MNRRQFLKGLVMGLAASSISPIETLKAMPTLTKEVVTGNFVKGNQLLSPSILAREMLRQLENDLLFNHKRNKKWL